METRQWGVADPEHLTLDAVSHGYPGTGRVLADVSLALPRGSFTAVVGPSGCGKSTLVRLLAGIEAPGAGRVALLGSTTEQARAAKRIGLVPQDAALLPWLSVADNVALPWRVNRGASSGRARAADRPGRRREQAHDVGALLASVGLAAAADRYPAQLSGGMRQRVAVARAFATRPDVLLLDEPFSALDELTAESLRSRLLALWEQTRATVVMVTHSVREAVVLADAVVVMSAHPGRVHAVVDVSGPRPRADGPALHAAEGAVRTALHAAWAAGAGTGVGAVAGTGTPA